MNISKGRNMQKRPQKSKYAKSKKFSFMKRFFTVLLVSIALIGMMSSCYAHKFAIGEGPKTGVVVTEKNHFFLFGLVPGKASDPQKMAGDAKDYEVTESMTFVDGLLNVITFGIYTPTTTSIQK